MHQEAINYLKSVKAKFPDKFHNSYVLDIGSRDINGNNRRLLKDCAYVGIDMQAGKNVDVVCHAINYETDIKYDLILCTEALEHDRLRVETIKRAVSLLKKGGLLVVTCAGIGRREHGTAERGPEDSPLTTGYYRNLDTQDIKWLLPDAVVTEDAARRDLYFYYIGQL